MVRTCSPFSSLAESRRAWAGLCGPPTEGAERTSKRGGKRLRTVLAGSGPGRSVTQSWDFWPCPSPSPGGEKENSHSGSLQVTPGLGCCSDYLRNVLWSHRVPTPMVSF